MSCPDVPTVAGTVFDGWYSDADYTGQKTTFPALVDGDTAFYARRVPFSEVFDGWYSDADYTGQKTTFPALIDGDTAFYARRIPIVSPGRSDGTAWFYVDGTLYRAVKVENGTVSCPDVPTVAGTVFDGWYSGTVFDGWYSDADYTGQKTTFPALIDGDTAFYAQRIPISEDDNDYMSAITVL